MSMSTLYLKVQKKMGVVKTPLIGRLTRLRKEG